MKRLVSGNKQKGFYQIVWNGKDKSAKEVSSGIYIAVLKSGNLTHSIKLSLIH